MTRTPGLLIFFILLLPVCQAAVPKDAAATADRWVTAKFLAFDEPVVSHKPYITVEPGPNLLARNRIQGRPLLIASLQYDSGIAMRSPGSITVELPSGARSFHAMLGVDSNDVGYYSNAGRGSVVASMEAGGRELYRSPLLHEGMESIPVDVQLNGAHEFTLRLKAVGERPPAYQAEWDQADWADARIVLPDRTAISLSDLPIGPLERHFSLQPPFSFRYGGQDSSQLLKSWPVERSSRKLDDQRTEYTSIYRDPATRLAVRCVAVAYRDFPTVEWTVYFKNGGRGRSPVLEDIKPLDTRFQGAAQEEVVLHHSQGSSDSATDFRPLETPLLPGALEHFASIGGRPTDGDMPYFNLAWPGRGVIFVLGWPGQWSLTVSRDQSPGVHVSGGQELTHFWLAPGEEVRTPLAVVQFWNGDWIDGQNIWRRWMIAHNLPRPGGQLPPPMLSAGSNRFTVEMQGANEANQKEYIDKVLAEKIPIDHWWMDAGWYPFTSGWWQTGTWDPDPKRFPHGLQPVDAYAHAKHLKVILWFEPERVTEDSWLAKNHPEWLIGNPEKDRLLFLGNPEAREWLIDHVSRMIAGEGIDVYRQDFNFAPLSLWRSHDTPDRQGITEIEHVEGYLTYFDALRSRFPRLLIDTCASGGRRDDLETLRRAVPLWRSDYPFEPQSQQGQTFGLALWVPYFGTAVNSVDPYFFRSQMTPAVGIGIAPQKIGNGAQLLRLISQWREIAPFFSDDFVPLTPYSLDPASWMAWQFNGQGGRSGVVEAFRHEGSPFVLSELKLRGLNPAADYSVENLDTAQERHFTGQELMEKGIPVTILTQPGSALLLYKEAAP